MKNCQLSPIIGLLFILISINCFAQQPKSLKWYTNYTEVTQLAAKDGKLVLLFFHGSDWCSPCMRMQKEVFADESFIKFASAMLLFLDVDFPVKIKLSDAQLKHNNDMKKKFGVEEEFSQGYPQVVIIDYTGKVFYQEKGYAGDGPNILIEKINSIVAKM